MSPKVRDLWVLLSETDHSMCCQRRRFTESNVFVAMCLSFVLVFNVLLFVYANFMRCSEMRATMADEDDDGEDAIASHGECLVVHT